MFHNRTTVLSAFSHLAHLDPETREPLRTFLPHRSNKHTFSQNVVVVLGARGTGKTTLFKLAENAATSVKLRAFFENYHIPDAHWFDAFSQGSSLHPEVGAMEAFGREVSDLGLRAFWAAHLLRMSRAQMTDAPSLDEPVRAILAVPPSEVSTWVPLAEKSVGPLFTALDATDRALGAQKRMIVALYDNLDRVAQFLPDVRRRYVRALLSLWLSLSSRYQHLRGKVFLRDDLFDATEIDFTDATKLKARSETLLWETDELFRLVARHVINVPNEEEALAARRVLQEVPGVSMEDRGEFGWMPAEMSEKVAKEFVARIAGTVIGRGVVKGPTNSWIFTRLKDAQRRITPRAMLSFFGYAAEAAREHLPPRGKVVFVPDDLLAAQRKASEDRVREVIEEYGFAKRLQGLRGLRVPIARERMVALLGTRLADEEPGIPEDGEPVLKELMRVGVLQEGEKAGEIDVPDIYRHGFSIGPDYVTAWRDLLEGNEKAARSTFQRELPELNRVLRELDIQWERIGEEQIEQKNYAEARRVCERALQGARSATDRSFEAHALRRLAEIDSEYLGDRDRAREELDKALALFRKQRDSYQEGRTLLRLAFVARDEGDWDKAQDFYEQALRLFEAESIWNWVAIAHFALAWLARLEFQFWKAAEHYAASLRMFLRAEETESLHHTWEGLSWCADLAARGEAALMFRFIEVELGGKSDPEALAQHLRIWPERLPPLRQQALEAYKRDKGHALLVETFPECTIPPFD